MTTFDSTHAMPRFAQAVDAALDRVAGSSPEFMAPAEKTEALVTLARVQDRLAALSLRIMATADDVCEGGAYRTVADLVAHQLHEDRAPIAADHRFALALERCDVVAAALAAGTLSVAKAKVITRAIGDLAGEPGVSVDIIADAERHLVSIAPEFTAKQLRRLAQRVLDVVAPGLADDRDARLLEADEQRALRKMSLSFRDAPDGLDGVTEIRARIPSAAAGRLRTVLDAFTSPRHQACSGRSPWNETPLGEYVPYDRRLAAAFCSLLEHLDPAKLPDHGRGSTTVLVTISLDALRKDLALGQMAAGVDGEQPLTAAEVRRLACTSDIVPVVLGGRSEILDLGRSSRLFTPQQRKALAVRDKQCRADGCSIPAPWCEAHHFREPWSRGGKTDLDDGKLLCSWHHHAAHGNRYVVSELPNGDVRFSRRT